MDDGIAIDVVDTRNDALLELVLGGHPDVAQDRAGELGEEAFNKVLLRSASSSIADMADLDKPWSSPRQRVTPFRSCSRRSMP